MKRVWHILRRLLTVIFVVVYVATALVNYSMVQSVAAAWAGKVLSERSGGTVRIRSIAANPIDHVIIHDAVIIDPEGDTVAWVGRLGVRFDGFPFRDHTLRFNYVSVADGGFHLNVKKKGEKLSLKFFLNLFAPEQPRVKGNPKPLTLSIRTVVMRNLRYHQDLPGRENPLPVGADIPHLDFSHVYGRVRGLTVDERGRVTCQLQTFQCQERRGLNIHEIKGDVDVGPQGILANNFELLTDSSHLLADVQLRFRDWKTTRYWCDSVDMHVLFKPGTELSMATAAYWAPTLWGMDTKARITGEVHGPVADMRVQNLSVRFGSATSVMLDGSVTGLPWIQNTVFDVNVEHLSTCYADLCAVRHPDRMKPVRVLPLIRQLGQTDIIAIFQGKISDFRAHLALNSDLGPLEAHIHMDRRGKAYAYAGELSSPSLRLAPLVGGADAALSATGFNLAVEGHDFNPSRMVASVEGRLFNTQIQGQRLAETSIEVEANHGIADLQVQVADTLLRVDLKGTANVTTRQPFVHMSADVAHADLKALGLWKNEADSVMRLSTLFEAQARLDLDRDDPIESLDGAVRVSRTLLQRNEASTRIDEFMLRASETSTHRKRLTLNSDLVSGDVRGYFAYGSLPLLLRRVCDQYVPAYYNPFAQRPEADYASVADATMSVRLTWNDSLGKCAPILPTLRIANNTHLEATYRYAQLQSLSLRSDSLRLGALGLSHLRLLGQDQGGAYRIECSADALSAGRLPLLCDMRLDLDAAPRSSVARLQWNNAEAGSDSTLGDVTLLLTSTPEGNRLAVGRHHILLGGQPWHIDSRDGVRFAKQSLDIPGLELSSHDQSLLLYARQQGQADDSLSATFRHFHLALLSPFLGNRGFSLDGTLDGRCALSHMDQHPMIDAGIDVADLVVNQQPLGDIGLLAAWSPDSNQLNLTLDSRLATEAGVRSPISATASLGLGGPEAQVQALLQLDRFSLQTAAPLVASFASGLDGSLNGALALDGPLAHPALTGSLHLADGRVTVNAINQEFLVDDTIRFAPDSIRLDHFTLRDPRGNEAVVEGTVTHQAFRNLAFDLSLHTDRFWVLNTTASHSPDFYGSVYAAAHARLVGNGDRIDVTGSASTAPGSRIFFPLDNHRQVKETSFIRFGMPDDVVADQARLDAGERQSKSTSLHVAVDLTVTPDVAVALPMDFSLVKAEVAATGQGDLRIAVEPNQPLDVRGAYEISSGSMDVTLASIYPKSFTIEQGSSIEFRGAINEAVLGIDAVYAQRVNLATLTGVASSSDHTSQTINVQDVIQVKGPLNSPNIGFDIRLPNADQSVEEEVFSYIDRNNEREMLNQCVSLLVAGQFYNANVSNSASIESSGISLVANAIGSVVSDLVSAVDINFDFTAATELTRQKFDVDINKDFGRFYLESTLGIGGIGEIDGREGNELTGDVLLGYKVRPNVHFFVFNRSNTNDYTRSDMPYKQGAGIKLTKDFDRISDLFKRKKNKP